MMSSPVFLHILNLYLLYNYHLQRQDLYEFMLIHINSQSQCCSKDIYIFTQHDRSSHRTTRFVASILAIKFSFSLIHSE